MGGCLTGAVGERYPECMARSRIILTGVLALSALALPGCLKRTIVITTAPEGALVWLNDVEVGRTPLETDFTFYGTYDVRIRREGYEPIITSRKADAPIHEAPGVDLIAEALPVNFHNKVEWHWVLTPVGENVLGKLEAEQALIERANAMRAEIPAPPPVPAPSPAPSSEPAPGAGASPTADPAAGSEPTPTP